MINLKIRINVDEQTFTLPVDTQFVPSIPEKDPVVMVTEITEPEELKYLERDEWNIEELNFLAKRMESFDKREQSQFDAAVSIFRPKTVEALINYTYNLPRFTLISDFSTPNAIGVSHILNRKQVMSLDEMASTDFAKIGKELMQSGKGITTPYGVLFVNEDIPFEPVYDGRHFPEYDYKGSLATVAVSRKGETEYLYLPCSIQDINHALSKLPAKTWGECECSLESSNFPAEDWSENSKSILANEGIYCLNNACEALQRLYDKSDFEKLSAAMQMADVDDSESIVVLANQLNNFIYIPDAKDKEDVGRYWIDNIVGYEYDEALENYIGFASFGEDVINEHDCSFLDTGGFIALEDGVSLNRMLETAKAERKFCEKTIQPKPAPYDNDLITGRFFFPLKITLNPYNEYGDVDWDAAEDLDGRFGDGYADEISDRFDRYTERDECDMIEYFDESDTAREKIRSAKWGFESIDGVLYGTVTVKLTEQLTEDEEDTFKEWIVGQNADGLGEGFEQQDIETDEGILNVHFWDSTDDYNEIRNRIIALGGSFNGTVRYATRRTFVAELTFEQKSCNIEVNNSINQKFIEISTRQASFNSMHTDEKIAEIANLIENMLKQGGKFALLNYDDVCCGFIDDATVKNYRNKMQCFRHCSDEAIAERKTYTEKQKTFFIDYGLTIVKAIHELKNKQF